MSNESKCPGHNRAECVSCCWPRLSAVGQWTPDELKELEGLNAKPLELNKTGAGYTAVDMTTAAAQAFRDGAASVVVELPKRFEIMEEIEGDTMRVLHNLSAKTWNSCLEDCAKAIIAAGGTVKE